jgi:predicted nucleic acid-binding protein
VSQSYPILADTAIWIAHFRADEPEMRAQLNDRNIVMHPFIVAELALGSLRDRGRTLKTLERLPQVRVAHLEEVRRMIEAHSLYSKGIGLTDAHLIASTLITPPARLWTRDKRLQAIAFALGIDAGLD